ncbi:MAG: acetoin utilization protein AcuC [Corynebacterium sp.]|nr:acetoin utilization protein AcuC [Corynebacterium sp.]
MRPLLIHNEELERYSFGKRHPMGPDRVRLAMQLAEHFGLLQMFEIVEPPPTSDALLRLIHTPEYLAALHSGDAAPEFGIGTADNPLVPQLPAVASRIVAGTVAAASAVWSGRTKRAVNISGGLHHAQAAELSGFCMLNDAAVAIKWLLNHGARRIAYIDLDAHHGDGVERLFWDDPRVVTMSVHESGLYLFPGTGHAGDIGGPNAYGTAVNVALETNVSDVDWLRNVHSIIPAILQRFRPEIIISQHGADPHREDPLTHLRISADALTVAYRSLAGWADRFAFGRWVALGGGGYQRDSVARVWTQVLAAVADVELNPAARMPDGWESTVGCRASKTLGDMDAVAGLVEFDPGHVMTHSADPSMIATSRAVFPYWGLVPFH